MINILKYEEDLWAVWTDTEGGERDGRCIGVGNTREAAVDEAMVELLSDVGELHVKGRGKG